MTTGAPIRRPTITDVAELAGVSHQTVSRYLRFNGGLKPATTARVEEAIEQLGYRPNLVARSMRTRRTGRLAVLMPTMAFNPSRMLAGASAAAHAAEYVVDVVSAEGGAKARTERLIELADSGQVEGILCLAPVLPDVQSRLRQTTTIVVSDSFDDEMRGTGALANPAPVEQMIERLAEMGHEHFFHVAGSEQFASSRARKQAYLDTISRLGLHSVGVFDGDWSGASGRAAVLSLDPSNLPTAVIAANDLVAAGVVRGAIERRWDVPGDLSVTGWDNDALGQFMVPSLTTVDIDHEGLGRDAMRKLIAELRGEDEPSGEQSIFELRWRESTDVAPGQNSR
jgi:DNA-binding LacI/PurR family transcriptional regulator